MSSPYCCPTRLALGGGPVSLACAPRIAATRSDSNPPTRRPGRRSEAEQPGLAHTEPGRKLMVRDFSAWTPLAVLGAVVIPSLPWLGLIALLIVRLAVNPQTELAAARLAISPSQPARHASANRRSDASRHASLIWSRDPR